MVQLPSEHIFVNTVADLGSFGYNPRTATGVDYVVIKAHIRNGEAGGGMLDCIFRVLLAVSHGASTVVVFCSHGIHKRALVQPHVCAPKLALLECTNACFWWQECLGG